MRKWFFIFSLVLYSPLFSQNDINKAAYYEFTLNPDIIWAVRTTEVLELPFEMQHFIDSLNAKFQAGLLEVYFPDTSSKIFSTDAFLKLQNRIDTIIEINVGLQVEESYYKSELELRNDVVKLEEVWFFDNKTKKLNSNVVNYFVLSSVYAKDGSFIGLESVFKKPNTSTINSTSKIKINRVLNIEYSNPIKKLFDQSIGQLLFENLELYNIVDSIGNRFENINDALSLGTIDLIVYDPITLEQKKILQENRLEYHFIEKYEIEEEWSMDLENFTIQKRILKITPVFGSSNLFNKSEIKQFSIIFD